MKIHTLSDVHQTPIGQGTQVWQYSIVLPGASIGENCNINSHCLVENGATIGDRVTLKCGVYVWDGITIEDDVFVGPNVTFVNNPYPRSKKHLSVHPTTLLKKGCSIGAGSTIMCNITIGEYALIGAGSMITRSIPNFALAYGNPAEIKGYVCKCGFKLDENYICTDCGEDLSQIIDNKDNS